MFVDLAVHSATKLQGLARAAPNPDVLGGADAAHRWLCVAARSMSIVDAGAV